MPAGGRALERYGCGRPGVGCLRYVHTEDVKVDAVAMTTQRAQVSGESVVSSLTCWVAAVWVSKRSAGWRALRGEDGVPRRT